MAAPAHERVRIFGIRHHGPGSARALGRALEEMRPDVVLIEGPPEADAIVDLAADPGMVPPVALLAHAVDGGDGRRAAFWPFAEFSPEWQAIRHALRAKVPVRFCDLPAAYLLADRPPEDVPADTGDVPGPDDGSGVALKPGDGSGDATAPGDRPGVTTAPGDGPGGDTAPDDGPGVATAPGDGPGGDTAPDDGPGGATVPGDGSGGGTVPGEESGLAVAVRLDPLARLAEAAGHDDAERWWEDVVEHRGGGPAPFEAVAEAMAALREHAPALPEDDLRWEERREAYMRRTVRRALKDGYERIAVVCGAWHVPAIAAALGPARSPGAPTAAGDDRALRGLPTTRVAMTWVPWSYGRLASRSGYGAGVTSPGWYHHLFTAPDRPIERWFTAVAAVLRAEDLPVSSAHVIEAVRLANALAALRDRPLAGLAEVTEAALAVLCEGAELPLDLIQRRMVVGERLGAVPDGAPMVPLQRDLRDEQRRLRFQPSASAKELDLDLRRPVDLDRSRLLHRLRLLGVPWGEPGESRRGKGTFRETWTLAWRPEFDVRLVEAGAWGLTVRSAASARARALAAEAGGLAELTALAERCLPADLGDALPAVMAALADRAAADTDVAHLMAALPALVRTLRYGDVRGTSAEPLRTVVDGLVVRICVGLPAEVTGLDDVAARALLGRVDDVHDALSLLGDGEHSARWHGMLAALIDRPGLHGLIEGRLTRLLLDGGLVDDRPADGRLPGGGPVDDVGGFAHGSDGADRTVGGIGDRMARAVSVGASPARAAAWIEGFLSGGGLILVHDDRLLGLVDDWIAGLPPESFTAVLPLLRRTFGTFEGPERRSIGERVARIGTASAPGLLEDEALDLERAAPAVRTVIGILGGSQADSGNSQAEHGSLQADLERSQAKPGPGDRPGAAGRVESRPDDGRGRP
ncbi:DUF5682 family protein [Actinoallomurus rhizosphaericola]|uniref:DUF5682 family protein n=1 Tax=Actinoallomurus rhizosphaericola TaxID=2952536 RepID=UPI002092E6D0|nr:DUF5682 family protein [Actinoallomurus rhizosphaericola]MCO5999477.1 DUF5682 family protein [Actinoallomurus rhizosphaericola]